ncbi:hypothetical protein [Achromobacter marplatensis]|uniref:TraG/VirB4 family ATPase n=1 Tax=Achromobacter marplatensis TaxID=470868 RepID=UPI003C7960D0
MRPKLSRSAIQGSFADFLNWGALVGPGVVVCKDGSFLAGWQVQGLDTESLDPEILDALLARIARGIASFGDKDAFWMRLDRRQFTGMEDDLIGHLPLAVRLLERESRGRLLDGALYTNALHLCLQHLPDDKSQPIASQVAEFERLARSVEVRMGNALKLTRLGAETVLRAAEPDVLTDGLVNHLASALSGEVRRTRVPEITEHMFLDTLLAVDFEQASLNSFPRINGRPRAVLSIEGLPAEYPPEALAQLEMLNMEYAWVSRFVPQSRAKTRAIVGELRKQWRQSAASISSQAAYGAGGDRDVHADAMAADITGVITEIGGGGMIYGGFASTLMIFGAWNETSDDLMEAVELVRAALQDVAFCVREERHAAAEAFLGTLPGHRHRRPRDVFISSRNFADLMPLRTLWKGEDYCPSPLFPKKSPTLMLGRSSSGELFRFNIHHGEVGHTMVFGPTSGGKSVLLGAMVGHFLKYPGAQVMFFDKRRSVQHATYAFGGSFTSFGGTDGVGVAPMAHTQELGRDWAINWLTEMMRLGNVEISTTVLDEIANAVDNMFENTAFSMRAVYEFVSLPQMRSVLAGHLRQASAQVSVLDAAHEDLDWRALTVFETHELFEMNPATAVLALDYIFAAVQKRFDGRPTLLVIDEAWAFLGHKIFVERIRSWLKEARKANVSVILATQSLADVVGSPITPVLLESCFTKIFLPNAGAKTEAASEQYKALGLTTAQIDLVASLIPKQDYYVVKPDCARVVDFDFGEVSLSLIGRTSVSESRAAAEAYKRDPQYWTADLASIIDKAYAAEPGEITPTNTGDKYDP